LGLARSAPTPPPEATVWLTLGDQSVLLQRQNQTVQFQQSALDGGIPLVPNVDVGSDDDNNGNVITIDSTQTFQVSTLPPLPFYSLRVSSVFSYSDVRFNTHLLLENIDGFGAALTDSSAWLLSQLKEQDYYVYNALLHTLFDTNSGGRLFTTTLLDD